MRKKDLIFDYRNYQEELKNVVYCWNVIDAGFSERVIAKTQDLILRDAPLITFLINSPGGFLQDAFAVVDFMRNIHCPIRTLGIGNVVSAALLIFLSGTKGKRIMSANTMVVSHQYAWETKKGEALRYGELENRRIFEDHLHQRIKEFYLEKTKLTEKNVEEFINIKDRFLTPKEMIKYGFVDKIL